MPKNRQPVVTPAEIEQWKKTINPATGKVFTQKEIADLYDVSPQYISWVKRTKTTSWSQTPREHVLENYPWETDRKTHGANINKRMRDHAEYMATLGKGMSEYKLTRLAKFHRFLEEENVVVEFDPNIPPNEHCSSGGFAFRERKDSDGDLIIRVNEYTTLTNAGKKIWRMPPKDRRIGG